MALPRATSDFFRFGWNRTRPRVTARHRAPPNGSGIAKDRTMMFGPTPSLAAPQARLGLDADRFRPVGDGLVYDRTRARPINPHTESVVRELGEWAAYHGLAVAPRVASCMQRSRFNLLAGYGHASACYEGFLLTAKWCTWLFFQDDWLCDREEGCGDGIMGPAALAQAHRHLLASLRGEQPDRACPLARSIHDIGQEILAWRGRTELDRFARHVADYFWGNEWEALNRVRRETPSLSSYVKMRPHAGAAYTAFDFWEIVEDLQLSDTLRASVPFAELRLMANNHISWTNDLYSLAKEVEEGNPNNLVLVLADERNCGIREAMRECVRMCNAEYRAFQALIADLPMLGFGGDNDKDLRPYAERLHAWGIGNIMWSPATPRYAERSTLVEGRA